MKKLVLLTTLTAGFNLALIGSANSATYGGEATGAAVTVTCAQAADTTESNRNVRVFQIVATACNQGGSCPNASPTSGYVERRLEATFSKCKDSTATAPRCSCG